MDSIKKRQEEATSDETLDELEDDEFLEGDLADDTDGPSPDGAFDEADEVEDADPV